MWDAQPENEDTNKGVSQALLQIALIPIGTGLPSPAVPLFIRPIRGPLPQMNRELIHINNDDAKYKALTLHHDEYVKNNDIYKDSLSVPIRSTVAKEHEDGEAWTHGIIE